MKNKEKLLSMLHSGDKPTWIGDNWEAYPEFGMVFDPISKSEAVLAFDEDTHLGIDPWGITWRRAPEDPGNVPVITDKTVVIKDIERWKEYVTIPDISHLDWSEAEAMAASVDRDEYLIKVPSFYGPFERLHFLLGFEESLMAPYMEPELFTEIMTALTDYKLEAFKQIIDHIHPDVIHSHDDWGDAQRLFMAPDMWRKLMKPHYQRLYSYAKERGVIVEHHSDGVCAGVEKDMVEIGIDIWQGVIPANDIEQVRGNTEGKLLLLGGIDQQVFDREDYNEELIRSEIRKSIDLYAEGGHFLPAIASGFAVYPEVDRIARDEMKKYGKIWMDKHYGA